MPFGPYLVSFAVIGFVASLVGGATLAFHQLVKAEQGTGIPIVGRAIRQKGFVPSVLGFVTLWSIDVAAMVLLAASTPSPQAFLPFVPTPLPTATPGPNRYVCSYHVPPNIEGKGDYGYLIEFGVLHTGTRGLFALANVKVPFVVGDGYIGQPLHPHTKDLRGLVMTGMQPVSVDCPTCLTRRAITPSVTVEESVYFYFETKEQVSEFSATFLKSWSSDLSQAKEELAPCPLPQ